MFSNKTRSPGYQDFFHVKKSGKFRSLEEMTFNKFVLISRLKILLLSLFWKISNLLEIFVPKYLSPLISISWNFPSCNNSYFKSLGLFSSTETKTLL